MSEPIWVPAQAVHIIHDRQIARHGGASGLRDEELLQGALQRPMNKWQYKNTDTFECAAGYAFDIAKAHAFMDGNKRTAFVTSVSLAGTVTANQILFATQENMNPSIV